MKTDWEAYYLDGRTPARQRATLRLMRSGIELTTESGSRLWWPYAKIRQTQGFYAGEEVRLEKGGEIPEALLVSDPAFLTALRRITPEMAARFHDPAHRRVRAKLTLIAAFAVIGITLGLYFWGIPAMADLVASRVPASWEEHLGASVVEQLAPPSRRCIDPTRMRAIEEIMTTLTDTLLDSPYTFRVMVVNNSAVNAFAAPGGYIVVFRGLIEATQAAEELAGVLAHEIQHIVKRHTTIGDRLCGNLRLLRMVRPIVRCHHERTDGSGYPDGLSGEAIPLLAQIMGVVDVYDALTTNRPYRPAMTAADACATLEQEADRGWRRADLVREFTALCRTGVLQRPDTLGLSPVQIGWSASAYIAGAVAGALGFGYLADRYGRGATLVTCLVLAALLSGSGIGIVERFSASRFWEDVRRFDASLAMGVFAIIPILLNQPPTARDKDHPLKSFYMGKSELDSALFERFGVHAVETYTSTEIGTRNFADAANHSQ